MKSTTTESPAFQRFVRLVVFSAVLLIWWGAATTTKKAGMVFADWPLSLGSVNPTGWLKHMAPFLEHSHRLLATWVGGLVLVLFGWVYARGWRRSLELVALILVLALVFGVYIAAGAERLSADRKSVLMTYATLLALVPVGWLIWSWWKRGWTSLQKLSALALLMVTAQAILGGLRVTEISNTFAVIHGCLAQAFFCLLLLIMLVAGHGHGLGYQGQSRAGGFQKLTSVLLVLTVSIQLILGASMRHFHREGLADTGLLKTQGSWIPELTEPIITVMFLHKWTGMVLFFYWTLVCVRFCLPHGRDLVSRPAKRYVGLIMVMLLAQVALGLLVIHTGKHFWLTNFHVINGLAILAVAFVHLVKTWCSGREPEPGGELHLALEES